ncbi:hypothetical protein BXP70_00460 [Hymenobacter crusticola]|uniref:Uncharacterized protein n=1 Tax=Hymenobacter crusticola TaxID=1770526 RepID=A0A243WJK9_9BACT|nr:hypothetical protein BXP70_00460 [Hymenobacter crusticola]
MLSNVRRQPKCSVWQLAFFRGEVTAIAFADEHFVVKAAPRQAWELVWAVSWRRAFKGFSYLG